MFGVVSATYPYHIRMRIKSMPFSSTKLNGNKILNLAK